MSVGCQPSCCDQWEPGCYLASLLTYSFLSDCGFVNSMANGETEINFELITKTQQPCVFLLCHWCCSIIDTVQEKPWQDHICYFLKAARDPFFSPELFLTSAGIRVGLRVGEGERPLSSKSAQQPHFMTSWWGEGCLSGHQTNVFCCHGIWWAVAMGQEGQFTNSHTRQWLQWRHHGVVCGCSQLCRTLQQVICNLGLYYCFYWARQFE